MREKLTKKDVEKIEQEIEHRKLVIRKEAIEDVYKRQTAYSVDGVKTMCYIINDAQPYANEMFDKQKNMA